eukprot:Ihof_evm10s107 gene=Ihof_evmTU10s107
MTRTEYVINLEEGGPDTLEFKDFGNLSGSTSSYHAPSQSSNTENYSFENDGGVMKSETRETNPPSLWTMNYYAQYFNVNTEDVTKRILLGIWPYKGSLLDTVSSNPDLYGPFWVTTTLIFTIGMTGNLATYIAKTEGAWQYDFTKVTSGATVMYSYVTLLPLAIWAFLTFYVKANIKLIEIVCLFGYSVAIYIPMSMICITPSEAVRWLVVVLAFALSSWTLLANLLPFIQSLHQKTAYIVLGMVALVQVSLALMF